MAERELICSEVWGGNGSIVTELQVPGMHGVLFSAACGGPKGGDVYYSSACAAGVLARVCLADVAGHGEAVSQLSTWLHESMRKTMLRIDPSRVFSMLNTQVAGFGETTLATAACLSFDAMSGNLRYCYAGHPPVLVKRANKPKWEPLSIESKRDASVRNVPLGVVDHAKFDVAVEQLNPGDRLFLYSDGVTEAPDAQGAQFGADGLLAFLNENSARNLTGIVEALGERLKSYSGVDSFRHDDVSFFLFEVLPRPSHTKAYYLFTNQLRRLRKKLQPA
ncbi:MAG: serine/threonine-protein phosphatase [Candidatus Hydrogenedentes bacterium]|nr:serine/threonine-protein phosphatase [Candidatus Hydrogenedentota bacterium]